MANSTETVWNRLDAEARSAVIRQCREWDCEPASLLAVVEIESAGRIFAQVNGRAEPLIRFEGHWFDRLLPPSRRGRARRAGLSHPSAGRVANPRSQAARWRLLWRAVEIDRTAALSSCSWGLGQVMGFHWKRLGYGSADALVTEARRGAAGQIALMVRFIEDAGLESALKARDWHRFARRYNGPAYARYGYHSKLAAAHARASRLDLSADPRLPETDADGPSDAGSTTPAIVGLRFGARGGRVRKLQSALAGAGHPLVVDGLFGIRTDRALREWQGRRGAPVTGAVSLSDAWHLFGPREVLTIVMKRVRALLPLGSARA